MAEAPTAADFWAQSGASAPVADAGAPTADEYFNPKPPAAPQASAPFDFGAAAKSVLHGAEILVDPSKLAEVAIPQSGMAHDAFWSAAAHTTTRVLNATGYGAADNWGARPLGLQPEDEDALRKAGIFNDYTTNHDSLIKSANEALLRPSIAAVDAAFRLLPAVAGGAGEASTQIGREIGGRETPNAQPSNLREAIAAPFAAAGELGQGVGAGAFMGEIGGQPLGTVPRVGEEAPAAPGAFEAERGSGPPPIAQDRSLVPTSEASTWTPGREQAFQDQMAQDAATARAAGVLGEGEAGYYGAAPLSPENLQARQSAAAEAGVSMPEPLAPPPDVHTLARRIDPETFGQYDELAASKERYRSALDDLVQDRETAPATMAVKTEIETILGRVNGVESRLTAAARGRLEDAQRRLDGILSTDTETMAFLRKGLMDTDFAMRDLAVPVSRAYRDAREMAPQLPEDAPVEAPAGEGAATPEAAAGEAPAPAAAVEPDRVGQEAASVGAEQAAAASGVAAEGQAAVAPPNVVGNEKLGAPAQGETTALGNPRVTSELKSIQGGEEEGVRRVAERSEENAIAAGLADDFGDLPTYGVLKDADQAAIVTKMLGEDYERAKAIAMGDREPPKGATPEAFLIGVENRALAEGDFDTAYRLKDSKLAKAGTTMGQRLSTYRTRTQASPVAAIQEVQAAREAALAARNVDVNAAKAQIANEIRSEVRKAASKPDAWADFVKSVTCSE